MAGRHSLDATHRVDRLHQIALCLSVWTDNYVTALKGLVEQTFAPHIVRGQNTDALDHGMVGRQLRPQGFD